MAKEINYSVGFGGKNVTANVMVVQYLLNCVPAGRGGPTAELAVDGIIGPKTLTAIRRFQSASFGKADGRVDPNGRTLQALQGYDPRPDQSLQDANFKTSLSGPGATSGGVFKVSGLPAPGATSGGVFKVSGPPAPGATSGGVFKSAGSPGGGGASGGSPFAPSGPPVMKQPWPPSPFGKQPGSGGSGKSGGGKWGG